MFLDVFLALAAFFIGLPVLTAALLFAGLLVIFVPLGLLALLCGSKE